MKVVELIKTGKTIGIIGRLSIMEFIEMGYLYYVFNEFNIPFNDGLLS
jgi:hypothetical protein